MKRALLLSVLFCVTFLAMIAQDIAVRALLDTNKGLIGDQLKLKLLVEQPSDKWQVTFPQVKDSLTRDIEIVSRSPVDTSRTQGGLSLSQEFLITVFDTGFFEVPSLPVVISSNSVNDTIHTLPVVFEMMAVKADSTIHDIRDVYRMPLSFREVFPWVLVLIGVWLLIWLILRLLKNRKIKQSGQVAYVRKVPADVIAMKELEKLKEEKPWLNNKIKIYYIRISEIIRTYLEDRYQIQAMEQTTDEIMDALKPMHIGEENYRLLLGMLSLSDLVKFAKVIPDPEENALQVDRAMEFVKNTKKKPEEDQSSELSESSKLSVENKDQSSELSESSKHYNRNK